MALPRGLAPRTSAFAGRHAESVTPREQMYPRQELRLRRELRKLAFYLLNYGDDLKMVRHAGAAPAWSALRVRCITGLCHGGMKWRSREDLHLKPPPSQGGMQDSLTPRERISPAGVAPASRVSETRILSAELRGRINWCVMPVLPRRPRFGRPPCLLLHQWRR